MQNKISVDDCEYTWTQLHNAYLGFDGSCGTYGAFKNKDLWHPAWIHPDCCDLQVADEQFNDAEQAILRSQSYFS